ncbi:hypothetical protein TNCV_2321161 [Trichonephila clavipes]|nr:hypothetical protein TNCV_2321161 [Trichonephila clavipes]
MRSIKERCSPKVSQSPRGLAVIVADLKWIPSALRQDLRNPNDPENYNNDWLVQSAACYTLAGHNLQSFHIYIPDMGWRLASRAICPEFSP